MACLSCRLDLLTAFDEVVPELADGMSPQGLCLTLCGFQAPEFKPSQHTLNCLSEQLYRMLPVFKPSEVACCLEAFFLFDYQPPAYIIAVSTFPLIFPFLSSLFAVSFFKYIMPG